VLSLNGCENGGRKYHHGDSFVWNGTSALGVFPYIFQIQDEQSSESHPHDERLTEQIHSIVKQVHLDILRILHHNQSTDDAPQTLDELLKVERAVEASAAHHGLLASQYATLATELAGACVRDQILIALLDKLHETNQQWQKQVLWSTLASAVEIREAELQRWVMTCMKNLFAGMNEDRVENRVERVEQRFWPYWDRIKSK
jgi:hypothetical protein